MFYSIFLLIVFSRSFNAFYLHDEETTEQEAPCNPGCKNGGQCFLSSFCICPKGFSGRYCEVSLHEQCGVFPSMTTIEVDCVLCICYNGLFTCDTQPLGLCRRKSQVLQTPSMRINRALATLQHRFKNIRSFEPMIMPNVSLDGKQLNSHRYVEIGFDEKTTYDAFFGTPLKSLLDAQHIDTVIIAGVLTQYCCETTARSAFVQNYNVIFLSDGTGPECPATLKIIGSGFGKVMTCAQLRSQLNKINRD